MFAGKARAYPSEASFRYSTLGQAPGLTHKHQTKLVRRLRDLAYYKNPSITDKKSFITLAPGVNVIKPFTIVIYYSCLARVFVPRKIFQPSLMLVGKARSLHQSGATERCFTLVGSGPTCKHQTRLENLARHKHSILLRKIKKTTDKKVYNIGLWRQCYKTFYFSNSRMFTIS